MKSKKLVRLWAVLESRAPLGDVVLQTSSLPYERFERYWRDDALINCG
jgi:hypothetical protein